MLLTLVKLFQVTPIKKPPKTMLGQFIPTDKTICSELLGRPFWMLPGSTPSLYSKANCTERPWNLQRQVLKATPASFLNLFLSVCLTKSKRQFLRQGSFKQLKIVLEQTQLPIKPKFTYSFLTHWKFPRPTFDGIFNYKAGFDLWMFITVERQCLEVET